MTNKIHEKILKVFGVILLVLVLINSLIHLFYWSDGWTEILWYCDLAAIILAFGILLKMPSLITTILVTSIPAQFFWILDFFLKIMGFVGLGRTSELFSWPVQTVFVSVILHLLIIPIAIYATIIYGFKKKSLLFAFIFILFCLFLPFFFSAYDDNINCVFYSCDLSFDEIITSNPLFFTGIVPYFSFTVIKSLCILFVSYFCLLVLFRRVFKRIKIV